MAKFRITHAQVTQWEYNANHPQFSQRTVMDDAEMMYLVQIKSEAIDLSKWWNTKGGRWLLIKAMDFSHLENTVDYFSRDGITLDPQRQAAFENVVIEYMKRKVDNETLTEKAIQLMENLDGQDEAKTDGQTGRV